MKIDIRLSAIIISKDEEKKIEDCLKSIAWADEIVFVDTGSTDDTINIAKKYTKNVYNYKGLGSYDTWRNFGLTKANGKWVFYLDSDERVSDKLKEEIINIASSTDTNVGLYVIPRLNNILGKFMKHGGWYPDYVKRLFLKSKLKGWKNKLHEEPIYLGGIGYLKNDLLHIKHDNISEMMVKTNKWSTVEAGAMYDAGHPPMNIVRFTTAMLREFWLRMIKEKSFLDGPEGVIYAIYQVWSRFISYAKLWEMQISRGDIK